MSSQLKGPSTLLGARASNAGDSYHELWALRAALRLLNPKSDLKAVTVEGVPEEGAATSSWDGVDCALYFGDTQVKTARHVDFQQLKYSTASPDTPWTVARLTHSDAKKGNNSVLRKLAATFTDAKSAISATATFAIQLISNQPLASDVTDAIGEIRKGNMADAEAKKFADATGLSGGTLVEFLSVLDFSQMGGSSHSELQDAITLELANIESDRADQRILQLQQEVRKLMQPGKERDRITQDKVLSWFQISSISGLFPAPADIKVILNPIDRKPAKDLLNEITKGSKIVCVHGPGGCGKTTTMTQTAGNLPAGSIAVTFDCYGAGRYTHTNDRRHLPENAFLQMANDLATAQGLPLLIAKSSSNPANVRMFLERLTQSAELLAKVEPNALVVVFIDAADNSVTAAEKSSPPSPCFVWELADADLSSLPANVRLVFSTRTGRKDTLQLPKGTPPVECPPFTRPETVEFTGSKLGKTSDAWIDEFQLLSNAIPRVQDYAFAKGGTSPDDVLNALRPSGKKLDAVLRELFKEASKKAGDSKFYSNCIAAIATLPAPIPLAHIANICQVSVDNITDFIIDVQPTLRIEDDTVAIADEDVEDFLTAEAASDKSGFLKLAAEYFGKIFRNDTYAAVHYCDLLAQCGRAAEILPIIEVDLAPAAIADPVVRREVQLRRLRLALGACRSANSPSDTVKVILLSAEAAKDEDALTELLEKEAELSVRFASGSLLRLVLSDRDSFPEQGPILVETAAKLALAGDLIGAREQLRMFYNWLDRRSSVPQDEAHRWKIELDSVVALAEARTLTEGAEIFAKRIRNWGRDWQPRVALALIPRLIARGRQPDVEKVYANKAVGRPWNLFVTVPLALAGYPIDVKRLSSDLSALRKRTVPSLRKLGHHEETWSLDYLELVVTSLEMGFARGVKKKILLRALDLVIDHREPPSFALHPSEPRKIETLLRAWLLREHLLGKKTTSENFLTVCEDAVRLPEKKKPGRKKKVKSTGGYDRTGDERKRTINTIFSLYESRVQILAEAASAPLSGRPKTDVGSFSHDSYYLEREYYGNQYRSNAGRSIARLMHIPGIDVKYLYERAEAVAAGKYDGAFATRSLPIWTEFLIRPDFHQDILEKVAKRADELRAVRTGAKNKTDALLKFGKLALNFSEADAKVFFERAVEITQEIDREAMIQIEFVASLAARHAVMSDTVKRTLAVKHAAFVTDVAIRLEGEEHFPWGRAVSTIYDLSPEVSLAAISQWQDEGIADLGDTLPALLRKRLATPEEILQSCILTSLLDYVSDETFTALADAAGALTPANGAFEFLSRKALLDTTPGHKRGHELQLEKAFPGKTEGAFSERIAALKASPPPPKAESAEEHYKVRASEILFPEGADFLTEAGIKAAIEGAKSDSDKGYLSLETTLSTVRARMASPAQKVAYLNVLSGYEGDALDVDYYAREILQILEAWKAQPAVATWRSHSVPDFIKRNLWPLSRWIRERDTKLPKLIEATGISAKQVQDLIAGALEADASGYSSGALFGLCELFAPALSPTDANDLCSWYVTRLCDGSPQTPGVPADVRERFVLAEMPTGLEAAFGRFLFALMSDIDLRNRWRAAHCLRHLVCHQGAGALKAVFAAYPETSDGAFRLRTAPFYWLAARQWATMTADRLSLEAPKETSTIKQALLKIAADTSLPHYFVRYHTKNALTRLTSGQFITLTAREAQDVAALNTPKVKPKAEDKRAKGGMGRYDAYKERRFKFDFTDTVPYWYSPLKEKFAQLSQDRFFKKLESILIDQWGVDPEANWWDKEPRKARYSDSANMKTHNGHGSKPTIERYGTYLEIHAMHTAAGEWIVTEPLAKTERWAGTFEDWVKDWLPTEYPTWIADRRSLAPFDPAFTIQTDGKDEQWLRRVPKEAFVATICGLGRRKSDEVAIYGDWELSSTKRGSSVDVATALVEPSTALSLARALGEKERRFWLPTERDHDHDEHDLTKTPFRLIPLVVRHEQDTELDVDDPLRRNTNRLRAAPAASLVARHSIREGELPLRSWLQGTTEWFRYEAWADWDDREDRRYVQRSIGSMGYRLLIKRNALLSIMKSEKLDLIATLSIERRLENEYGEPARWDDDKKRRSSRKVLILRKSGAIEGVNGRIGTW
jgi:hypothetical protein